jgi:hypothetical protein
MRQARQTTGLLGAGLLLIMAACGDDGGSGLIGMENTEPGAAPDQIVDEAPTETGGPDTGTTAPEDETLRVDAEFYYWGFLFEAGEARFVVEQPEDDFGFAAYTVEVDAVVENLRPDEQTLNGHDVDLEWGGATASNRGEGAGAVRAGASAGMTFVFDVDETFTFDDATLYAGTPDQIRASVPLANPEGTYAAAPIPLEGAKDHEPDENLEVEITEMWLYAYDAWDSYSDQQGIDSPILAVTVDITRLDDGFYGANIFSEHFRLELPDGTQISANSMDGLSGVIPGSGASTHTGVVVTFELDGVPFEPDELTGETYVLVGGGSSVSWDGSPEPRAPFELTAAPVGETGGGPGAPGADDYRDDTTDGADSGDG